MSSDDAWACRGSGHNCVADMVGSDQSAGVNDKGLGSSRCHRFECTHLTLDGPVVLADFFGVPRKVNVVCCLLCGDCGGDEPQAGVGLVAATSAYRLDSWCGPAAKGTTSRLRTTRTDQLRHDDLRPC